MKHTKTVPARILVVDDQPLVLELLRCALQAHGHIVELFTNPLEALQRWASSSFNLVITDYQMPEMKGDRLAELIKEKKPEQKLMILTATPEQLFQSKNRIMANLIMGKPIHPSKFLAAVDRLLTPERSSISQTRSCAA